MQSDKRIFSKKSDKNVSYQVRKEIDIRQLTYQDDRLKENKFFISHSMVLIFQKFEEKAKTSNITV